MSTKARLLSKLFAPGGAIADGSVQASKISGTITVATGGTGASTAAAARDNLGLEIGSDVQQWHSVLDNLIALGGTAGFLKKSGANNWTLDTSVYITGNQTITFSGDASGSGTTSVTLTLANSGVTAGTYGSATNIPQFAVDAKGRVTSVSNVAVSIPSGSLTFTGDVTGSGSTGASTALTLANSGITAGTYTKVTVDAKGRATGGTTLVASDIPSLDASKIASGTIDAARLPSYVDDVLEYANLAGFPASGETGKIYVAIDTNRSYRWSGSTYVQITSGGAVDSVAGKTGVVTLTSSDVGLGSVENKNSATIRSEITSSNVTTALGFTPYNATNPSGYITSSALTAYLPLAGGTLTGLVTFDGGSTASAGPVITSSSSSGPRLSIHSTGPGGKNLWLISNSTDNADGAGKLQLWNSTDGYTGLTFATTSSMAHMLYGAYTQMSGSARAPIFYDTNDTGYYIDAASTSVLNSTVMYGNLSNYQPIGASDDVRTGIRMYDTTAMAAGIGGQIVLGYKYTSGGDYTEGAIIKMYKLNGTSGDYSSGLKIQVRDNGEPLATQVVVDPSGNLYSYQSVRAPIFYDSNDTDYYIDPNSYSRINTIALGNAGSLIGSGNTYPLSIYHNTRYLMGFRNSASGTSNYPWLVHDNWNGDAVIFHFNGIADRFRFSSGGIGQADSDFRAPIFYDSNDTSYYTDPNSGSRLAHLYVGNVSSSNDGGWNARLNVVGSSHARLDVVSNSDGIITTMYSHTGQGVGRVGTYSNHPLILMAQGGAVGGYVYSGSLRSSLLYDQDDTSYYIDPNSTSDSALRMRGGALFGPNTNWSAYLYVGTNGRVGSEATVAVTNGNLHLDSKNGYQMYLNWYSTENIYTQGNLGLGAASASYRLHVHGTGYATNDFRSPIFYDSNDTGYYIDPNSTSVLNYAYIYRNFVRRENLVHSGISWYSPNYTSWCEYMSPAGQSGSGPTGNITAPSGGLVTSWALRSFIENASGYGWTFESGSASGQPSVVAEIRSSDGSAQFNGMVRTPIYYDSNDTGYYLDPNSTGVALRIAGAIRGDHVAWTGEHNKIQWHSAHMYFQNMADGYWIFRKSNGAEPFIFHADGWGQASGSWRAPVFYDSNNTAYYTDPASTSVLSTVQFASGVYIQSASTAGDRNLKVRGTSSSDVGITGHDASDNWRFQLYASSGNYGFLNGLWGGWDLQKSISGNLYMNNNSSYYLNAPSDNYLYRVYGAADIRSPIFYDNNDTGYYIDPNSSSNINTIYANNWFRSYSSTGWYNQSYEGGIYMVDTTWVRVYNSKAFYVENQIAATGNVTAYYSDERLKTKVGRIENALDKVCSLEGFLYVNNDIAKANGYISDKVQVALSAQQVQQVQPEVVSLAPFDMHTDEFSGEITSKSGENYLTVDYSRLVPLLVEAIKEQQQTIQQQASRIEKLEKLLQQLI